MAGLVVLTILGLVALLATGSSTDRNVPAGPSDLPAAPIFSSVVQEPPTRFYTPPDPLPNVLPGTILRSEPIADAPAGISATRILYMSAKANGEPVAVSGMIAQPVAPPPAGGRPLVAFAHGTAGIGRECAISAAPFTPGTAGASMWDPRMRPLVDEGWVVVASDYENAGAPGTPTYMVEAAEGQQVLDSLRAAVYLDPDGTDAANMAIWGHSQGGHAALSAAGLWKPYAPELQLRGVVGSAPGLVPSLPLVIQQLVANPGDADQSAARAAYIFSIVQSWSDTFPGQLQPGDYLTPEGIALLPESLKYCYGQLAQHLRVPFTEIVRSDPAFSMLNIAYHNMPVDRKIEMPVLLQQGLADTDVVPQLTIAAAESLCRLGTDVELRTFPDDTHETLLWSARSSMLDWIADRFDRDPAVSTCGGR